jgi:serine/threonine-protein kinase
VTLPGSVDGALSLLTAALDQHEGLGRAMRATWQLGDRRVPPSTEAAALPPEVRAAVELVERELPPITCAGDRAVLDALGAAFAGPHGVVLSSWCSASTWRLDARLAPLLARAAAHRPESVVAIARDRVVEGPLVDALACAPLLGPGERLDAPENAEAMARLAILVWEAGASALESPHLGPWIWGSPTTFDVMVRRPARGTLQGRVLAARCLEIAASGLPATCDPSLVGATLQVLQPLFLHPEPLVWVHAARALGRLTGSLGELEGMLLDWVLGERPLLRRRAITAFASLPAARLGFLGGQLDAIVRAKDADGPTLAAVAAATPYLFAERRATWDVLAERVVAGEGGAVAARALARGLATLWRRGDRAPDVEAGLRAVRDLARRSRPTSMDELRRTLEVVAVTDAVDAAERDPLDLEIGLENLVRIAAQYDDEEADARAARFASGLAPAFEEARRVVISPGRARARAAAVNALEGAARSFALRLWRPLLATSPAGDPVEEPDLSPTAALLARAPRELVDLVNDARRTEGADAELVAALEVLAVRLGGYALDAASGDELASGRAAHDTCLWLRRLDGLVTGERAFAPALSDALASLFWRLVDVTRGTALGEVDDAEWLGPFAAWWALVVDRPTVLTKLATALPLISDDALARTCEAAEALRTAVASGAADGAWGDEAGLALEALSASDTELAHALALLARSLGRFRAAAGPKPDLDVLCLDLVLAGDRLQSALANPTRALHGATNAPADDSFSRTTTENAPRVAALLTRAIRARDPKVVDVWLTSLGPVASTLLEQAVKGAISRTPPPPVKKKQPTAIEGYDLVKPLGEGGIGSVWLVRKPGADRLFVLKIPKADVLAGANDVEREGILTSFVQEAAALAGLYHPNVANIIDRGISDGAPYLVLEYLIGADLKQYSSAKPMSFFELRQVVLDACAGLAALHGAGLVHRDIKPANLWLRLPLAGGVRFEPDEHRDPARTPPLSTVVIDFGMVRATRIGAEAAGRFVAGTAGYMAPEQVLDPVELDVRADVYSLAGTIYNVVTRRAFFDELKTPRDRVLAHMRTDPFEDPARLAGFPAAVAKVLRAATALRAADRPTALELGREFAAAL